MDAFEVAKSLGALLFVLALFLVAAWVFRRVGIEQKFHLRNAKVPRQMEVAESLMLDAKHRLVLVKRAEKRYVILLGGAQGVLIESFTQGENAHE